VLSWQWAYAIEISCRYIWLIHFHGTVHNKYGKLNRISFSIYPNAFALALVVHPFYSWAPRAEFLPHVEILGKRSRHHLLFTLSFTAHRKEVSVQHFRGQISRTIYCTIACRRIVIIVIDGGRVFTINLQFCDYAGFFFLIVTTMFYGVYVCFIGLIRGYIVQYR